MITLHNMLFSLASSKSKNQLNQGQLLQLCYLIKETCQDYYTLTSSWLKLKPLWGDYSQRY